MNKVSVITLGCSKNTVDSERLMKQLQINNIELTEDTQEADGLIINTCGFIEAAKQESINTILEACEMKKSGKAKKIYVFGCLSERYMEDLKNEIPEVDMYFGIEAYDEILEAIKPDFQKELIGERFITTPSHYAYLKISDGCNNPCSFCAIPLIRGKFRSKPIEELVTEAKSLSAQGVKELILIAQDSTYYGLDIYKKRELPKLLNSLAEVDGIEWIRLLYAYPRNFPEEILDIIRDNPKVCTYIDMPLQHISDNVLKSMKRYIGSQKTKEVVRNIRQRVPEITFRSTFIVGYPNETEKDFEELCDFIEETKFDRLGTFTFSPEENTTSFPLGDPIPEEVKEARLATLMGLQQEISTELNRKQIGSNKKVIIDRLEGNYFIGRSERETPEVDGEILITPNKIIKPGNFYNVNITDSNEYDLFAEIIE